MSKLSIQLPNGKNLFEPFDLRLAANENVLVSGPSGSGKSTLFRALSGVWPYSEGIVNKPDGASVMVMPQKPYLPIGTLLAAVSYPQPVGTYSVEAIKTALQDVQLDGLVEAIDLDDNWSQRLSGGEQQRLAVARAILAKPDWLLLDEATAAMDPKLEKAIYETISARLPNTTVVSIAHRETLNQHHERHLTMQPQTSGGYVPSDSKAAAE